MEYNKNDEIVLEITDIGTDGEGIGKINGYTLFVKDAVPGDTIKAKIMKTKNNYGYARLVEVLNESCDRVLPKCKIARQCGGCQLQAISYKRQLIFKQDKVKSNLCRIGGFDDNLIDEISESICGMEEPYRYRNKAQYPIGYDKSGELVVGFYAGRTHDIIPCPDCELGARENEIILQKVLDWMKKNNVKPYNEVSHTGIIRHILIRKGFSTGQLMICLVINADKLKKTEQLIESLTDIPGMKSISFSTNKEKNNVIMGNSYTTIWGEDYIEDTINDIKFKISPLSFYQVNPAQTKNMYGKALEYAALTGKETVWDLYCGIGTITLTMSKKAAKVYGVEIVPQAIMDARNNAIANGINNAEFFVGKAEEVLPSFYDKNKSGQNDMLHPDVIVVDPPRKGCDTKCLETMIKMSPGRIVYVSCDSATLARDLKYLCENGYGLKKVSTFDNFPQTVHVETVCLLSRKP